MNRILQVAGVLDRDECEWLSRSGITDLGFPVGPGVRTPDLSTEAAHALAQTLPASVSPVAIVYLNRAESLGEFVTRFPAFRKIQLHAALPREEVRRFRTRFPQHYLLKSIVIRPDSQAPALAAECCEWSDLIDAFITDTYDPATGAFGATGKTHNWELSRAVVLASPRPVILAGGLNPSNVAQAIEQVGPAGVDVHSGVEGPDGRKNPNLLNLFLEAAASLALPPRGLSRFLDV